MLDIFLDMTHTGKGAFGRIGGGRCAVGAILWEIGIPHDRLLHMTALSTLSEPDQILCEERFPDLKQDEGNIEAHYDCLVDCINTIRSQLKHPPVPPSFYQWLNEASSRASMLMQYGKKIDVNFIIASPLPKLATKPQEVVHA